MDLRNSDFDGNHHYHQQQQNQQVRGQIEGGRTEKQGSKRLAFILAKQEIPT